MRFLLWLHTKIVHFLIAWTLDNSENETVCVLVLKHNKLSCTICLQFWVVSSGNQWNLIVISTLNGFLTLSDCFQTNSLHFLISLTLDNSENDVNSVLVLKHRKWLCTICLQFWVVVWERITVKLCFHVNMIRFCGFSILLSLTNRTFPDSFNTEQHRNRNN